MQRAYAIVAILALLSMPMLLPASEAADCNECARMCCPVHRPHSPQKQSSNTATNEDPATCSHGPGVHLMKCQMRADHSGALSNPVAPFPPMILSAVKGLALPSGLNEIPMAEQEKFSPGFSPQPFEPPRA
jgi:hypothetical protein